MIPEKRLIWTHPLLQVEEILDATGRWRVVVHRGVFAAVCLHLRTSGGEEAFLLVRQHRPTQTQPFYEHPAGMLDPGESPLQAALREVAEETGWLLSEEDLMPLTPHPLYPSPAFWHEKGYFFAARFEVPAALLERYRTGLDRPLPDEPLHLIAVPPTQILSLTHNLQTVAHTLLYYAHFGAPDGKVPSLSAGGPSAPA